MGAVLAGGGDGGVRWWCRLWLWYLRLARRLEHLGLLVGVGRVGVVEARGVAGEHLDKRLGRHLLARVIDLAALVNVHAGHTLGGGLGEELAGGGVLRRVGDVVDGEGDNLLVRDPRPLEDLVGVAHVGLVAVVAVARGAGDEHGPVVALGDVGRLGELDLGGAEGGGEVQDGCEHGARCRGIGLR